jgi:DNA polymerase
MIDAYANGRDLYKEVMAAQLGIPLSEVTKSHRDRGKVIILGCGYGMGWEKFIEYALTYGIVLTEKEAKEAVYGFRDTYPEIVSFWGELNAACLTAFKASICVYVRGLVVDGRDEKCLKIKLPSGRFIHYHKPRLTMEPPPWGGPPKEGIHFVMYGSKGAKDNRLYGGLLCENVVQAVARDLLLSGMLEAEAAGASVIMTVHDEIVAEVPTTGAFGENELFACMTKVPEWGEGMGFVLKAECWEGAYYRK